MTRLGLGCSLARATTRADSCHRFFSARPAPRSAWQASLSKASAVALVRGFNSRP